MYVYMCVCIYHLFTNEGKVFNQIENFFLLYSLLVRQK